MQELFASRQFTEVVKTTLGQLFLYFRRLSGLYVPADTRFGISMNRAEENTAPTYTSWRKISLTAEVI